MERICYARTHADQQVRCAVCRLVWDQDDPNPPECGQLNVDNRHKRRQGGRYGNDANIFRVPCR